MSLKFKKYLLPTGFGLFLINIFFAAWSSASIFVYDALFGTFGMVIIAAQALAIMLIILGTLFDFENARYVKIGSFIASPPSPRSASTICLKISAASARLKTY